MSQRELYSTEYRRNDGGPAFPNEKGYTVADRRGMALRDYFAAQAMVQAFPNGILSRVDFRDTARDCYAIADAMLAERAK